MATTVTPAISNSIGLAAQYLPLLDEIYKAESKTAILGFRLGVNGAVGNLPVYHISGTGKHMAPFCISVGCSRCLSGRRSRLGTALKYHIVISVAIENITSACSSAITRSFLCGNNGTINNC